MRGTRCVRCGLEKQTAPDLLCDKCRPFPASETPEEILAFKILAQRYIEASNEVCKTTSLKLDPESIKLLSELYGNIWVEVYYDPFSDETKKFASSLLPLIEKLNKILRFRK